MRTHKGMSLMHMLAAMLIVAILMGIAFTLYEQAVVAAKRVQCQNHLRQIYQYWMMYLSDKGDVMDRLEDLEEHALPGTGSMYLKTLLEQYLTRKEGHPVDLTPIFTCPADELHTREEIFWRGSYDYRDELSRTHRAFTFSDITQPQNKIIMGDFRGGWHDTWMQRTISDETQRHINVLFADGHVEWITEKEWQDNLRQSLC